MIVRLLVPEEVVVIDMGVFLVTDTGHGREEGRQDVVVCYRRFIRCEGK